MAAHPKKKPVANRIVAATAPYPQWKNAAQELSSQTSFPPLQAAATVASAAPSTQKSIVSAPKEAPKAVAAKTASSSSALSSAPKASNSITNAPGQKTHPVQSQLTSNPPVKPAASPAQNVTMALPGNKPAAPTGVAQPVSAPPKAAASTSATSSSAAAKPAPSAVLVPRSRSVASQNPSPATRLSGSGKAPAAAVSHAAASVPPAAPLDNRGASSSSRVGSEVKRRSAPPGLSREEPQPTAAFERENLGGGDAKKSQPHLDFIERLSLRQWIDSTEGMSTKEWFSPTPGIYKELALDQDPPILSQEATLFRAVISEDYGTVLSFIHQAVSNVEIRNMFRGLWEDLPLVQRSMLAGAWNVTLLLLKNALFLDLPLHYRDLLYGQTALTLALGLHHNKIGNMEVISALIEASQVFEHEGPFFSDGRPGKGFSLVNVSDQDGTTPLMWAVRWSGNGKHENGFHQIVEQLLAARADITAMKAGETIESFANSKNKVIRKLLADARLQAEEEDEEADETQSMTDYPQAMQGGLSYGEFQARLAAPTILAPAPQPAFLMSSAHAPAIPLMATMPMSFQYTHGPVAPAVSSGPLPPQPIGDSKAKADKKAAPPGLSAPVAGTNPVITGMTMATGLESRFKKTADDPVHDPQKEMAAGHRDSKQVTSQPTSAELMPCINSLTQAIRQDNVPAVQKLAEDATKDPGILAAFNTLSKDGGTLLHLSILHKASKVTAYLLAHLEELGLTSCLDHCDNEGNSPLFFALARDDFSSVNLLLDASEKLGTTESLINRQHKEDGMTPLMMLLSGDEESTPQQQEVIQLVKKFLDLKANITLLDNENLSVSDYVAENQTITQMLKDYGELSPTQGTDPAPKSVPPSSSSARETVIPVLGREWSTRRAGKPASNSLEVADPSHSTLTLVGNRGAK